MSYTPSTDFLGLWRSSGGNVSKLEMPGIDFLIAALGRAGVINVTVSATAPVANQSTTAWLQAAVPSYSAEGVFQLWNTAISAYQPATPALFLQFLEASAGQTGVSWFQTVGGAPANTVGNNGDYAIRTDEPGGIYGPKASGAWPATPIAGTTDIVSSLQLDLSFGAAPGNLVYRAAALWQALAIGGANTLLTSSGTAPAWQGLSAFLDTVFGNAQGDILYRDAAAWKALPPGVAGQVLSTQGAAANPIWVAKTPEFPSGTVMIFQQTSAPTGWTKQTALNDYGLRVTNGTVGTTSGSAFSTVFAQTVVGNTTLTAAQIPAHTHNYTAVRAGGGALSGGNAPSVPLNSDTAGNVTDSGTGGGGAHNHSINLTLAYTDVIIATKN